MKQAIIIGASFQGQVVHEVLRAQGVYQVIGYLDDNALKQHNLINDIPVLGGLEWIVHHSNERLSCIIAIGNNNIRMDIGSRLRTLNIHLLNAVHPSAVVMNNTRMGSNNLINSGAILVTGTNLEDDVVINTGATIDHNSYIKTGAYISPGVHTAGCITIGRGSFIGTGSILGPGVVIGDYSIVGAGSLVLSDLPSNVLAYGTPAKVIKEIKTPIKWRNILDGKLISDKNEE